MRVKTLLRNVLGLCQAVVICGWELHDGERPRLKVRVRTKALQPWPKQRRQPKSSSCVYLVRALVGRLRAHSSPIHHVRSHIDGGMSHRPARPAMASRGPPSPAGRRGSPARRGEHRSPCPVPTSSVLVDGSPPPAPLRHLLAFECLALRAA